MVALNPEKKVAGVLAPVFALRGNGDLGIGDTESLKEFIAWSAKHGLGVVQVLPINETGSDNSPYNLLSALAIEPSTIATTPDALPDLTKDDFATITAKHDLAALQQGPVKYAETKKLKRELLQAAYKKFAGRGGDKKRREAFAKFEKKEKWLADYALHRALVSWHGEAEVSLDWPEEHRSQPAATAWLKALAPTPKRKFRDLVKYHAYVQWVAFDQWMGVRAFAEKQGVALMGDIPVGVSIYSADVWQHPELFDPKRSSGAPPEKVFKSDPFTEKWGQNWGFPLYNWEAMAQDDYAWWRLRLRLTMGIFHLIRVDHALGFFRIYSFPWRPEENARFTPLSHDEAMAITGGELPRFMDRDDSNDENREYNRQHGERLFTMLLEETGPQRLIAEDLGEVAPYVRPELQKLEIPGFKIPQWERRWDNGPLTPASEYQRLSLATFATHDHPPMKTHWNWLFAETQSTEKWRVDAAIHQMWEFMDFCGKPDTKLPQTFTTEIHDTLVRGLFASNSWLAIHMITDLAGTDERFNVPGSAGDQNWTQRMPLPISQWDEAWKPTLAALEEALKATGR